jgi:hypothetical protein
MGTPKLGFGDTYAALMPINIQLNLIEKSSEQLVGFATNPLV